MTRSIWVMLMGIARPASIAAHSARTVPRVGTAKTRSTFWVTGNEDSVLFLEVFSHRVGKPLVKLAVGFGEGVFLVGLLLRLHLLKLVGEGIPRLTALPINLTHIADDPLV